MSDSTTLVLGAGGYSLFHYLGAASIMATKGELEKINRFVCSGAGTYLGSLLACGISPWDIIKVFQKIKKLVPIGVIFDIISKAQTKSLDLFQRLREIFQMFCIKTHGEIPTLGILAEKGMKLEVVVTNLKNLKPVTLSAETHPEVKLDWLVMLSLAGPGLMENNSYQGVNYASGALTNPLPIDESSAIVFALRMPPFKEGLGIPSGMYQMFCIPMEALQRQILEKNRHRADLKIYVFQSNTQDFLGFTLGPSDQMEMIHAGQQQYGHHLRSIISASELEAYADDPFA